MGARGGHTVFHFVRLPDRKITESTPAISVGHSGRFCYLSAGRLGAPGLRPKRGQGNRETDREQSRAERSTEESQSRGG